MSDKTVLTDDAIYQMAKDAGFFLHDEQLKLEYPIGYSEAQKRMLKFARAVLAAAMPGQVGACMQPIGKLLSDLWHHQGGSSEVGQPIRRLFGMGQHEPLSFEQIQLAKAYEASLKSASVSEQKGDV